MLENHLELSLSRRLATEDLVVPLFDEHRGGLLNGVGERESAPCDGPGGQEHAARLCARMCTAVGMVGVGCA